MGGVITIYCTKWLKAQLNIIVVFPVHYGSPGSHGNTSARFVTVLFWSDNRPVTSVPECTS